MNDRFLLQSEARTGTTFVTAALVAFILFNDMRQDCFGLLQAAEACRQTLAIPFYHAPVGVI